MKKYILIFFAVIGCKTAPPVAPADSYTLSPNHSTAGATLSRPNIVLILTDDQQSASIASMPNVQRLFGAEGVTFTNAFCATPLCCPSRSTILSGQYSHKTGVLSNQDGSKLNTAATVAVWLHGAGYRTGMFGKYLNRYNSTVIPSGWDDWRVCVDPAEDTFSYFNYTLNENGNFIAYGSQPTDYLTDVLRVKALNFIRTVDARPYFIYFAPFASHLPADPAPRHVGMFAGLASWRPVNYNEADVSDKPAWLRKLPLLTATTGGALDGDRIKQYESLQAVDEAVAAIVAAMDSAGRGQNTIFFFLTDNGYMVGEHRLHGKRAPYEESVRTPFLVRARGWIAAPRLQSEMVSTVDLASTFCAYGGVTPTVPQNGISLRSLIDTGQAANWRSDILLEHRATYNVPAWYGVRNSQYIYVAYDKGDKELYDLSVDPYELSNKAGKTAYKTVQAQLAARLQILKAQ